MATAFFLDRTSAVKLGDYSDEVVEYRFKSRQYADAFATANHVVAENAETLEKELSEAISTMQGTPLSD